MPPISETQRNQHPSYNTVGHARPLLACINQGRQCLWRKDPLTRRFRFLVQTSVHVSISGFCLSHRDYSMSRVHTFETTYGSCCPPVSCATAAAAHLNTTLIKVIKVKANHPCCKVLRFHYILDIAIVTHFSIHLLESPPRHSHKQESWFATCQICRA